jgi:pentatricopeptide repeat protein
MSFFSELKRRNVFRIATAYAIAAWLLLQIADLVLDNTSAPPWVIQSLFVIIGIGFVFALIFSWLYELTPEGVMKESAVPRERSITYHTAKKLDYLTIALLLGAVAYVVVDRYVLEAPVAAKPGIAKDVSAGTPADAAAAPSAGTMATSTAASATSPTAAAPVAEPNSIAVLPFVNMSADADNEYFSDGISEELMNVLVKVNSLRVASRTSAFSFKGKDKPIPEIARELNVNNILEGSVRKSGRRVRITAQLIDVSTDKHLWSETYDRELTDIFDIQAEISNAIVSALKVALKVEDQQAVSHAQQLTDNAEAYELYLRGRYLWRKRGEENLRAAVSLFEQAIALDPNFARAHEALASTWDVMTAWSDQPITETLPLAETSARRALELDPILSEAHAVLADVALIQGDYHGIIRHYEIALKNEPKNAQTREWYAEVTAGLGYLRTALQLNREALELDPASPALNYNAVWISGVNKDSDRAYAHFPAVRDMLVSQPFDPNIAEFLSLVSQEELQRYINAYTDGIGQGYMDCIAVASGKGREQSAAEQNSRLESLTSNPQALIHCLVHMGRVEEAMDLFEQRVNLDIYKLSEAWYPCKHSTVMRQSPHFREILNATGLSAFYLEYGLPDLCHRVGDNDFACN